MSDTNQPDTVAGAVAQTRSSDSPSNLPVTPLLQVGDRIKLSIHDLAFGGAGVGRHQDMVVFVPFVCPGEVVDVKITEVKRHFARGVLAHLFESAPERRKPECRFFEECGGCQYQHLDYAAQLYWKHKQVADLFVRIGGFSGDLVKPLIPCPKPYAYRNRILVRSQWNRPAKTLNLGYMRHDSGLVADIDTCAIAEPELNAALQEWRRNPPPKGGIKTTLRMEAVGWEVPNHSFFQNNFHVLPQLVQVVRDRLSDAISRHLIDAYCGVGFFALELAASVDSFLGVELDVHAIRAAKRNQIARGIQNGEFVAGDTDDLLPSLLQKLDPKQTTVLLDPPRVGCRPRSLDVLRETQPSQILYVSCHPATLARDLKLLCAEGRYELHQVQPVDMFPQTQHVECLADLRACE
jgi:tRNA/tmRNA/rRNA uracil-C5-methylase (TrmA/RlmC/RlmD family)